MKISVVIPVYNGSKTIEYLVDEICKSLTSQSFEIILVNDGSKDSSESVCEKIASSNKKVNLISLRKNFGEHNAVMCGLNYCTGDYATIVDDDFQNPPSEILKLVNEIEKGFDVVYSKYASKKHGLFRNIGSSINNKMADWLLKKPKELYLSSFKIINRATINEITKYKGPFPYIDGLILRTTNNISSVVVEHQSRKEGKSNYTLKKLISLYLNMFLNFSILPLRLFTFIGAISFIIGFIFSIYFIVNKILNPQEVLGWTSLIVAILTLSGVQLIFLGLIGEYIGKQYLDQNKTPQWVVKKEILNNK